MTDTRENDILKVLDFYGVLERPLTLLELQRLLPFKGTFDALYSILQTLENRGSIFSSEGFFSTKKLSVMKRKRQDLLLDEKWENLFRRRVWFSFLPFTDFIFISGSLALGNVRETSDFDVLVGCKEGRIFTVRFLSVILFGILGMRRKRLDHKVSANNKICLNHFVTPTRYALTPPYSIYWEELYKSLVPFLGFEEAIRHFWTANKELIKEEPSFMDRRFSETHANILRTFLEGVLKGKVGDMFEAILKKIQIGMIEKHLGEGAVGFKPRLIYTDNELEFHPDTKRIEEMLATMEVSR